MLDDRHNYPAGLQHSRDLLDGALQVLDLHQCMNRDDARKGGLGKREVRGWRLECLVLFAGELGHARVRVDADDAVSTLDQVMSDTPLAAADVEDRERRGR